MEMFVLNKTSYLNEEVNCTGPPPSVRVTWSKAWSPLFVGAKGYLKPASKKLLIYKHSSLFRLSIYETNAEDFITLSPGGCTKNIFTAVIV